MSMRSWTFWDWVGYLTLGLAAFFLAVVEGAKKLPSVPDFVEWPITPFLPLLFFFLGSVILVCRAMGWLGPSVGRRRAEENQPVAPAPPMRAGGLTSEVKQAPKIDVSKVSAKKRYTERERSERYDAWSRIYRVLNDQCSAALDKGSYVSNTWKESILASPKSYSESMSEFQRMASASLNQITAIYKEYEYLIDIRDYFENSWGSAQHPLWESMTILRETLKRFPENPPRQMVELLDPQAQAFRQGVRGVGKWITEAKAHSAQKLNELSA